MKELTTNEIKQIVELAGKESGFSSAPRGKIRDPLNHHWTAENIQDSPWFPLLIVKAIDGINRSRVPSPYIQTTIEGVFVYDCIGNMLHAWWWDDAYREFTAYGEYEPDPDQARLSAVKLYLEHK